MSTAVVVRPRLFRDMHRPPGRDDAPRRRPDPSGGRPTTLEQHLERVWEGLVAKKPVRCPVCGSGGQWRRVATTHPPGPAGSGFECGGCASTVA